MKVRIGRFPPHWRCEIHRRYMERKYQGKEHMMPKRDWDRMDHFMDRLDDVVQWFYNLVPNRIFAKMSRKVKVRIEYHDIWDMCSTLALVVTPMLEMYQKNKHGAPNTDDEDVPEHLRSTADPDYDPSGHDTDKYHFDRWDYIINEMIFAFKMQNEDWESQFYSGEYDKISVPLDKDQNEVENKDDAVFYRIESGPNDTFEVDREGMEVMRKRIQNGLRLFGKYYENLWD